ncbi:hypothetical protein Tco_0502550 [Tanacetum coccineum]
MPALEDIIIFDSSRDDEDDGGEVNMNNLDTTIQVSPNPTTRIHKDHPLDQVIGDLKSATQTRRMSKNLEEHRFVSTIKQRTNHKDLQNCLFASFLSQEPKKILWVTYTSSNAIKKMLFFSMKDEKEYMYVHTPAIIRKIQTLPDRVYKVAQAIMTTSSSQSQMSRIASTTKGTQNPLLKDDDGKEVEFICIGQMIGSLMCKKQTVAANSTTEAEYVAASSCCGQVLWISESTT